MKNKNKIIWGIIGIIILFLIGFIYSNVNKKSQDTIKIGWISDLTGPVAKYGAYEAGMLAVEDINNAGGINGKKLVLIVEDGKCNSKAAVDAANKLINIDKVKIIIGGHCTPESAAIAPIAEKNKIIMLASITSSPVLTNMGDYIFRTSPISTVQSSILANFSYNKLKIKKIAIIYEQTDYARPIAEKLKDEFLNLGGKVLIFESFSPGTTDFRTILEKVKNEKVDAIFFDPQSPDATYNFMKQIKEINIKIQLLGNDVTSNKLIIDKIPESFEGFILAIPNFNENNLKTKEFIERYKNKYNVDSIPQDIWTAESYDGVIIVGDMLKKCGETNPDCMKDFLYGLKNYQGVSGTFSIDSNGDGIRDYNLKIIKNGTIINYEN